MAGDWKRSKRPLTTGRFSSWASGANPRFWNLGDLRHLSNQSTQSPTSRGFGFYPHPQKSGKTWVSEIYLKDLVQIDSVQPSDLVIISTSLGYGAD